jgi:hypothetical protein
LLTDVVQPCVFGEGEGDGVGVGDDDELDTASVGVGPVTVLFAPPAQAALRAMPVSTSKRADRARHEFVIRG